MIRSFAELQTEVIWSGRRGRTPPFVIQAVGAACCVAEPSESARRPQSSGRQSTGGAEGNQAGQHSVRLNDQWRNCFVWLEGRTKRCRERRLP